MPESFLHQVHNFCFFFVKHKFNPSQPKKHYCTKTQQKVKKRNPTAPTISYDSLSRNIGITMQEFSYGSKSISEPFQSPTPLSVLLLQITSVITLSLTSNTVSKIKEHKKITCDLATNLNFAPNHPVFSFRASSYLYLRCFFISLSVAASLNMF